MDRRENDDEGDEDDEAADLLEEDMALMQQEMDGAPQEVRVEGGGTGARLERPAGLSVGARALTPVTPHARAGRRHR